jgi:hypothetical protein
MRKRVALFGAFLLSMPMFLVSCDNIHSALEEGIKEDYAETKNVDHLKFDVIDCVPYLDSNKVVHKAMKTLTCSDSHFVVTQERSVLGDIVVNINPGAEAINLPVSIRYYSAEDNIDETHEKIYHIYARSYDNYIKDILGEDWEPESDGISCSSHVSLEVGGNTPNATSISGSASFRYNSTDNSCKTSVSITDVSVSTIGGYHVTGKNYSGSECQYNVKTHMLTCGPTSFDVGRSDNKESITIKNYLALESTTNEYFRTLDKYLAYIGDTQDITPLQKRGYDFENLFPASDAGANNYDMYFAEIDGHVGYEVQDVKNYVDLAENVTMPSSFRGQDIISLAKCAFFQQKHMKSVVLPKKLMYLGSNSFSFCSAMTSAVLPSTLETIELESFEGCTSLKELVIPKSVKTVNIGSFGLCTCPLYIESATIPAGWNKDWNYKFEGKYYLGTEWGYVNGVPTVGAAKSVADTQTTETSSTDALTSEAQKVRDFVKAHASIAEQGQYILKVSSGIYLDYVETINSFMLVYGYQCYCDDFYGKSDDYVFQFYLIFQTIDKSYGKFTSGPDQNTDYYALTISGVNVSNHGFSSFGEQKVDTDLYPAYDSRNQEYAKSAMTELLKTVEDYLVTNNLPHLY